MSSSPEIVVSFPLAKESIRKFVFNLPRPHVVYHVYPTLSAFRGKSIPDGNNPRSHDETLLTSRVAKAIRRTLEKSPHHFKTTNRGGLVIAHSAHYDDQKQEFTLRLTKWETRVVNGETIRARDGLADGATTAQVIAGMQGEGCWEAELTAAQIHLEVLVFFDAEDDDDGLFDFIFDICEARNTSQQVRPWSIADFKGEFDWLKTLMNEKHPGKVAFDENASGEVTVLDVLAILNLFHPYFTGTRAPTASYSSKGSMPSAYQGRGDGFRLLEPVVEDILSLHDYVYSTFNATYRNDSVTKRSLRRYVDAVNGTKVFKEHQPPVKLKFTDYTAELDVDKGLLFPILASFRALLDFNGKVTWFMDPKRFWDEHGAELMERLLDAFVHQHKKNPQSVGKDANVYRSLWDAVNSIRRNEELRRRDEEVRRLKEQLGQRQPAS